MTFVHDWERGEKPAPFEHRGATFEAPRGWKEESVLFLTAPGPRPAPNVAVQRVSVSGDETLDTFAAKKIAELSALLAGFEIEDSRETTVAGVRAIALRVTWEDLEGPMIQRHVFLKVSDGVFLVSGTSMAVHEPKLQPFFDHVVGTFRLTGTTARPSAAK